MKYSFFFRILSIKSFFEILDESGSDSEEEEEEEADSPNSCYSSLSDFVSEMRNSEICGEIRGKKF